MIFEEVMLELESYGSDSIKAIFKKHGAKEPLFGVKVEDMKKILKKTKKNHALSLKLFQSNNADAMYLAGLMADETKISKEDLQDWVKRAYYSALSEFAVPWVASETAFGFELGKEWITSEQENIASAPPLGSLPLAFSHGPSGPCCSAIGAIHWDDATP